MFVSTVPLWLLIHFEDCQERFLWDLYAAHFLHALLAFLLLLEQLSFSRDITAVTLRNHILPERLHRLTRNHFVSNRGLDRNFEQLSGDQLLHLFGKCASLGLSSAAMQDQRQRINRFACNQHVELHQIAFPVTGEVVVERSITTRD